MDRIAKRRVGVVMLDTRFPRLLGDIGNPDSFRCAVAYQRVRGATVAAVVTREAVDAKLADDIATAARDLAGEGAELIVTSCGFLGALQQGLERALPVPVIASALALIPFVRAVVGADALIGVLTFDSRMLTADHFAGHYDDRIAIEGIEQGQELYPVIAEDRPGLDPARAAQDAAAATARLMARSPVPRAIVLECTNLSPYIDRIRAASGLPVFDLLQAAHWTLEAL